MTLDNLMGLSYEPTEALTDEPSLLLPPESDHRMPRSHSSRRRHGGDRRGPEVE